jgi:AraC family transcriptional regulator
MKAMRKSWDADEQFPFNLVYRDTKEPQHELPDHLHDWLELVYVHQGRGTFFINHTFYEMEEGDLFLIPGNTIHCAFPNADTPVTSSAVFFSEHWVRHAEWDSTFSMLRCYDRARRQHVYKAETTSAESHEIINLLARMHDELLRKAPGYRQSIMLHLQQLLLGLSRRTAAADHAGVSGTQPLWMRDTLTYIDRSLGQDLSLAALCRRVAVSPSHFSRVFKQLTGLNLTAYILTKRIAHAKEALVRTDLTMHEIAADCGFDSSSYFFRTFKKLTGVTPLAYKRAKRI